MKQARENQWEEALKLLAPVFDASTNGIVVINARGEILVYNQAALRLLDDGGPVPLGSHFSQIRPEVWSDFQQIIKTGQAQLGCKIQSYATTIIANRNPIVVGGEVVGVISLFQDISAYETIISSLQGYQELHRQLEAIFESSYDGLYITDGKANTIRVNGAYERITGLNRQDMIGRNTADLVREQIIDQSVTLEVLQKGCSVTIMQNIKGGKQLMVTGTPIFDENGDIAIVVTNVHDMTELNQLRAQLEESRLLSSRYYQTLVEREQYEDALRDMVVKSEVMARVVKRAIKAAATDATVLLQGESGVGKTMLARIIHRMSPRRVGPFVKISCGTIPASLMESELFGYSRGAFTGAAPGGKAGLIEVAHEGTVFLDEIGELSPAMQVGLLQVIEEQTFTRVGSTNPTQVDVRVIAATNRDLKEQVRQGAFREDLFYRLNVVPIQIPPLRMRREDIPAMALKVLAQAPAGSQGPQRMDPAVLDALVAYDFPGNVRELINLLERMAVMAEGSTLTLADLPRELREFPQGRGRLVGPGLKEAVESLEAEMIRNALAEGRDLAGTAARLGVHPTTLWRKMSRYGLRKRLA